MLDPVDDGQSTICFELSSAAVLRICDETRLTDISRLEPTVIGKRFRIKLGPFEVSLEHVRPSQPDLSP